MDVSSGEVEAEWVTVKRKSGKKESTRNSGSVIQIFVKMDNCKTVTQHVTLSDTLSDIMRRIPNNLCCSKGNMYMIFGGNVLRWSDVKTCSVQKSLGSQERDTLDDTAVVVREPPTSDCRKKALECGSSACNKRRVFHLCELRTTKTLSHPQGNHSQNSAGQDCATVEFETTYSVDAQGRRHSGYQKFRAVARSTNWRRGSRTKEVTAYIGGRSTTCT